MVSACRKALFLLCHPLKCKKRKYRLTRADLDGIIQHEICASAGTGRQARLRCVCLRRTGSSPVSRTSVPRSHENGGADFFKGAESKEEQRGRVGCSPYPLSGVAYGGKEGFYALLEETGGRPGG